METARVEYKVMTFLWIALLDINVLFSTATAISIYYCQTLLYIKIHYLDDKLDDKYRLDIMFAFSFLSWSASINRWL